MRSEHSGDRPEIPIDVSYDWKPVDLPFVWATNNQLLRQATQTARDRTRSRRNEFHFVGQRTTTFELVTKPA